MSRPTCTRCGHDVPADLDMTHFNYVTRQYVPRCKDSETCAHRREAVLRSRLAHPSMGLPTVGIVLGVACWVVIGAVAAWRLS